MLNHTLIQANVADSSSLNARRTDHPEPTARLPARLLSERAVPRADQETERP